MLQSVLNEHVICAETCKPLIDLGQRQTEDRLLEDESVTSKVQIEHNQRNCDRLEQGCVNVSVRSAL